MAVSAEGTRHGERTEAGAAARGGDAFRRALAGRVDGEIRFDPGTRAAYAHDASDYQQPPIGVVVPRTVGAPCRAPCRRSRPPWRAWTKGRPPRPS
ncbi:MULTISPECIES: hypothetical protein [unclassified Spirillospora]|uniref:hypothetical protein n=1 Tax=unclassified Spirillospora TaxID=2642701 RepID=UPI00371874E1